MENALLKIGVQIPFQLKEFAAAVTENDVVLENQSKLKVFGFDKVAICLTYSNQLDR